ncbi:MAG: MFS transporter [Candidatus Micrarchaeia archaeon]
MKNKSKINRNILNLGFVSLLTDISSEMIFSILPVFMSSVLMLDKSVIGLIEGVSESSSSIFKFFSSKSEKLFGGSKRVILFGYGLSTFVKPLFAFASNWWQVLLFRFGDRVGKGIRGPARDSIIANSSNRNNRGFSFGLHRTMDSAGAVIGPLVAFFILAYFNNNYNLVFFSSFIPGILAVLIIWFFVNEKKKTAKKILEKEEVGSKNSCKYNWFLVSVSLFALGNMSFAFLLIRVQEIGVEIEFIPIAYLLYNLSYMSFSIPFGKLSDRIGKINSLSVAFFIFAVVFAGFVFINEVWLAVLFLIIYGVGMAGIDTIQRVVASEIVPKEKRTSSFGTYQGLVGILALPASLIAGSLWGGLGFNYAFLFSFIMSLAAVLVLQEVKK